MRRTRYTDDPEEAASILRKGGLVAFPTETVYGLGGDATAPGTVQAIFDAKQRPADNPLIVHLHSAALVHRVARSISKDAELLMDRFFPGPLTLVMLRSAGLPATVSAGLETVGVRVPDHPLAAQFLDACGVPVAAPSANRSGRPSPTTWQAVRDDLDGRIDAVLRGAQTRTGLESTVVDCTGVSPVILRVGSVTVEDIQGVVPTVSVDDGTMGLSVRSPGTRHRHYAPLARVHRVDAIPEPSPDAAFIGLKRPHAVFGLVSVHADVEQYARALFDFFRRCDALGMRDVYCESVPDIGLGRALMDRVDRAASARQRR